MMPGAGEGFEALDSYLLDLAQKLTPGERTKLGRRIAAALRTANADRIGRNVDPEGSAFEPRKRPRRRRNGGGAAGLRSRQKGKMFLRAKARQYLREQVTSGEARVGYVGAMARIMSVHQEGLEDTVTRDPSSPIVKYPARRVLGFGPDDRLRVLELMDSHLSA